MATKKRNKQDELNRTYRKADVGRVGSSLRNQGYSQDNKGNTYYTVNGVKYNAATGKPVKNQPAKAQKPAAKPASVQSAVSARSGGGSSSPKVAATTSGSSSGSSRPTPPASRQTGDKEKDMATWAQANPNLGKALGARQTTRGTSKTDNPLLKNDEWLMGRMKAREAKAADLEQAKKDAANATVTKPSAGGRTTASQIPRQNPDVSESTVGKRSDKSSDDRTKTAFSGDSVANTTVPNSKNYSSSKVTNNTSTAYSSSTDSLNKNAETLAEKIRKRRLG